MSKRALLHKSKIEEFKSFLIENQVQYRSGKGDFQVLQVEVNGHFYPIYNRFSGDHFTVQKELFGLVHKFVKGKVA